MEKVVVKKEIQCKECGKDISIRTCVLWTGHKVEDYYLCDECYKKRNQKVEEKSAEK